MKLVQALCLIGASAVSLHQKETLPDYYNDERYGGVWNWHIQDDPRIGAPATFTSDTLAAFPGYDMMTDTEYGTRLAKFGTYATAAIDMNGVGGAAPVTDPNPPYGFTIGSIMQRDGTRNRKPF